MVSGRKQISGIVARGNFPTPKFWAVWKFSSCRKIFVQRCKIWGWKHPLSSKLKFFSTYNDFYQKSAAVWIVRNLWYMLKGCNFMSRVRFLTMMPLKQMLIISHFQNWQSAQFSSSHSILQVLTSFLHTEHDESDGPPDAVGWTSRPFCRTVQTGCQWTVLITAKKQNWGFSNCYHYLS